MYVESLLQALIQTIYAITRLRLGHNWVITLLSGGILWTQVSIPMRVQMSIWANVNLVRAYVNLNISLNRPILDLYVEYIRPT